MELCPMGLACEGSWPVFVWTVTALVSPGGEREADAAPESAGDATRPGPDVEDDAPAPAPEQPAAGRLRAGALPGRRAGPTQPRRGAGSAHSTLPAVTTQSAENDVHTERGRFRVCDPETAAPRDLPAQREFTWGSHCGPRKHGR